jgi:phosphoserine phosphatase
MKDLVLIGSIHESAASEWQHRTDASAIVRLAPDAVLLSGTQGDPALLEQAQSAGFDAFFRHPPLAAADFRLLAMDMDSTLITIECIDEIADMVGVKPQVAAITEAAMRGELDFPGALRRRVALLKGLQVEALDRVYNERLRLSPGAENLLAAARAYGWNTLLVSGGFTYFTDRLRQRLGLDHTLANTLEVIDGRLTGEVLGEIVDASVKATRVKAACEALGCSPAQAIVAGDGANDLQMMHIAGLSVAFHAKPVVRREATIAINHSGLDALLLRFS